MANYTSAGVYKKEIDLTTIVPNVSTSIGAFAGYFAWGPVDELVLISSQSDLVSRFGKPSNNNAESWFAAANFLDYGNKEYISRAGDTTSANGVLSAIGSFTSNLSSNVVIASTIKNINDFKAKDGTFDSNVLYVAKYPGVPGNSIRISVCDTANGYASQVNLISNTVANGSITLSIGTSTGRVIFTPIGVTPIGTVNTFASNVMSNFTVGDYLEAGNTTIGVQNLKIASISNVSSNTSAVWFDFGFTSPYRLRSDFIITTATRKWEFYNLTQAPGVSIYNAKYGANTQDELHAVVIDQDGAFTNVPGTVLEVHKGLSRATDARSDNNTGIYYKDYINQNSQYVWCVNDRPGAASNTALNVVSATIPPTPTVNLNFYGAVDGHNEANTTLAPVYAAWEKYINEAIEIDLVICGKSVGGIMGEQLPNFVIDNICTVRTDCVPFVSQPYSVAVSNKGREWTDSLTFKGFLRDTSYEFVDSGYKYQEDRYNNVYRWIPLCGDIAGLAARTDQQKDSWWSFAGFNRGQIKNCIKLAWSPTQSERDIIYPMGVNPVVTFSGMGTFLYGDRTGQSKSSAFDRINVRRLFIALERAISKAAKYSLFELNDQFTRAAFRNMVVPFLKDVQSRRGVTDFFVQCDETVNTPQVIDRNEFIANIYIKPARSINWITLNFIAVGTGVTFNTVIGQF